MFYKLDDIVRNMRYFGEKIISFNYIILSDRPVFFSESSILEEDLSIFKHREATVDGYSLMLYYQKSEFNDNYMESLQVYGVNMPFLPFNLVCKLARRFLGSENLALVEIFKNGRKIYIWSVCVDDDGNPIEAPYEKEAEQCEFEGFEYFYLKPSQVSFY